MTHWDDIDVVLLDMDGTLLDLHFDTHFWLEHVPQRYAERRGMGVEQAKAEIYPRLRRIEGTMQWYCLDYWSAQLDLDLLRLKHEVAHLIAPQPHAVEFLRAVAGSGRQLRLVTNAHAKSLALKLERTGLGVHFDAVVCSHDLGIPKEDGRFWREFHAREPFDPGRALLVDDNLAVLRAARAFGIAHLRAVHRPDSHAPPRATEEFEAITTWREFMPPGRG